MTRSVQYIIVGLLIAVGAFALAGYPIMPVEVLGSLGAAPFVVGDITEVKNLIRQQGEAWEEYKRTNDALIRAKADGRAVSELEAKLARISDELNRLADARDAMEGALLSLQRSRLGGGDIVGVGDVAAEVKSFNTMRNAFGRALPEVDRGEYLAYKAAFDKMMRRGRELLTADEVKALQAGVDSDGGYLLPPPTVGRMVKRIFELSPIRSIANVQTISTDALEGVADTDQAAFGWVSETGSRSTTATPKLDKYRIEAHEMYASPKTTQKVLDDAGFDAEEWLVGKVADRFARVEGAAFITGTGVGQPRGFTKYTTAATADGSRTWGELEHVVSGANGDFAASNPADKLFDLVGALKTAHQQNAVWVSAREVITKIRKFKEATTNAYMWQPGLQRGQPDQLLGYPIVNAQDMPALATGSLSLAFGDFREGYLIADRIGFRVLRDPYTDKPYVVFYGTKRVGGGVVNSEAIKLMKFSA